GPAVRPPRGRPALVPPARDRRCNGRPSSPAGEEGRLGVRRAHRAPHTPRSNRARHPSYDDWVDPVVDFLAHERSRDDRPIVLYGLSAGGMLAYHVAAMTVLLNDRTSSANRVSVRFLDRYAHYAPAVEPEDFVTEHTA
ncbi:alpha/beta fold hydrolase, partial [Streptomyces sp. NPDC002867]